MTTFDEGPVIVKKLPECQSRRCRKEFLSEIKHLVCESYRPQLILDLSSSPLEPETLDLLLNCIEELERAEGRVSIAGASKEAAAILELTRLTSVVDVFSSVSEAVGSRVLFPFATHGQTDLQQATA
jgi:anti-anti-sigma regulatory factor